MTETSIALAVTAGSLFLSLLSGLPIAFGLILSALLGAFTVHGVDAIYMMGSTPFSHTSGFSLLAIPMFIFMGNILLEFGIGAVLFRNINKLVGRTRGGLAMASTIMCAVFGFVCGSSSASCATIGGNTLPQMEERGYDRRLALGTLATAGSIAVMIPPSIIMVIYAVLANASLGAVMIAGILPGLFLTGVTLLYIYLRVLVNPKLAPLDNNHATFREKLFATMNLLPLGMLFLIIIGGLFFGIWDAIEASAVGVICALALCLLYFKRLTWIPLRNALKSTVQTSVMIYMLIVGGNILAYVFFVTGIQEMLENALLEPDFPAWVVLIIIGLIYMALGTFLDVIAMLTITVPIFLPIITELGYSPIWFGVYAVLFSEMALITPPVGINLFVIKGVAPAGTRVMDVALGAAPYVLVIWVVALTLIMVPSLALYLPSIMRG